MTTRLQKTFGSTDAAFKWYRKLGTKEEVIVTVAGRHVKFFRDSRGLIDQVFVANEVTPNMVECLDCGALVAWGEPCPACGLGSV